MFRSSVLFIVAALLLASCGYARSEAVSVSGEPDSGEIADQTQAIDPATGLPVETENGPPPTLLPVVEIPSKGNSDEVVVNIGFEGEEPVEITFGALDDVVQPSVASRQFQSLGQFPATFDVDVLDLLVVSEMLDVELAARNVEVSDAAQNESDDLLMGQVSAALAEGAGEPGGERDEAAEQLFEDAPYLALLSNVQAKRTALVEHFAEVSVAGDAPCVSHIMVAEEQAAADLATEIEGGADFVELVQEHSLDEASKEADGALGCSTFEGTVFPEFTEAISSAAVGEVAGPVQTQEGWHLLLVTEFAPEEITPEELAQREFFTAIDARFEGAAVEIDERVGTWDAEEFQVVAAAV